MPRFYDFTTQERKNITAQFSGLSLSEQKNISNFKSLSNELTNTFIENSIGTFSMPFGIATNFIINNEEHLIPMAVEESSVIAAASHGAKLARFQGGFTTISSDPIMTGQIQLHLHSQCQYESILKEKKTDLINFANEGQHRLTQRGGGTKNITWYYIKEIKSLIILIHINTCDAMGANIVNTICEKLSKKIITYFPKAQMGLRILTNLTTQRLAQATCKISPKQLHLDPKQANLIIEKIYQAYLFAKYDTMRATTHNKGIMNGIDPILIATGNDWRAVEAGAHAYAAHKKKYSPLSNWWIDDDKNLCGKLKIPMAVGTVGGVTKLHPTAQVALKILKQPNAQKLAEIITAVGLAQNLSALRALSDEGIQEGHMNLHQQNIEQLKKQQNYSINIQ